MQIVVSPISSNSESQARFALEHKCRHFRRLWSMKSLKDLESLANKLGWFQRWFLQSREVKYHMICIVYGCAAAPLSHARKLTHEVPDNRNIIWMGVEWTSPYYDVGRTRFKDMAACQGKADHQGWKECLL